MPSEEERNVAALDSWTEIIEEGRLDLVGRLVAPSYVRHNVSGTMTETPAGYAEKIAAMRADAPGLRFKYHDVIARGDRVIARYSTMHTNPETGEAEPRNSTMCIWRLEEGKFAEHWVAARFSGAGPWQDECSPREEWSIATGGELTPEEQANLATEDRHMEMRRTHDPSGIEAEFSDPNLVHGPGPTRAETLDDFAKRISAEPEEWPGISFALRDRFIVGNKIVSRATQLWNDATTELSSPLEFIGITRLDGGKIVERWQVAPPPGVSWE